MSPGHNSVIKYAPRCSNLTTDPKHADILKTLKKQLAEWCKTQNDKIALKHLTE
jgi:hypothetical protein